MRQHCGYDKDSFERQIKEEVDMETFCHQAPQFNPNASLIKGVICGHRVEEIRFLCGLVLRITTLYCPPAPKKPGDENSTEFRKGFSPEQALLGFGIKCTPGLEEQVARAVAL